MAVVDVAKKTLFLKIVYYGCALGGKTTNLVTLHRLTDPDGKQGLVSIATKDDRTLFFDLLPLDLGQVGGFTVRVKVYTVPGQVHYELTRRQVLAGSDGVVLVVDSSPDLRKANSWAAENLRSNLKANRIDPDKIPSVFQWNKRDLPGARPVEEMLRELAPEGAVHHEAVATTGTGVAKTFASVVKEAIRAAYLNTGRKLPPESVDATVDKALAEALAREPALDAPPSPAEAPAAAERMAFEHRTDSDTYRDDWAEKGRDRQILDQETLLSEAVQTGMELAERLDGLGQVQEAHGKLERMLAAVSKLAPELKDPKAPALAPGLLGRLLQASGRSRGSLLLFKAGDNVMEEREVVPEGRDLLNSVTAPSIGSAAHRLCQGEKPRHVEDLAAEVFFDAPPSEASEVISCLVLPLSCEGLSFGALVVYGGVEEPPLEAAERDYWSIAASIAGLSLHWRALRQKVAQAGASAAGR